MTKWEILAEKIAEEFEHHPQDFLREHWVSKTMHPFMRPLTFAYWRELVEKPYFTDTLLLAAEDGTFGKPVQFDDYPAISPQSIQHCYYLDMMAERLGARIDEMGDIVELGGGYGNFARIARALGHKGRYQIVDLPPIHRMQKAYLDATSPGHGVEFISAKDVEGGDLLVATFSVSEMPMALRDYYETKYPAFRKLFFGTTTTFDGIENVPYFQALSDRLGAQFFKDKHRSAWFMTCAR